MTKGKRAGEILRALPALPREMHGNAGRERRRYRLVTRTLGALSVGESETGDPAEDWRRAVSELDMLWQMSRVGEFRSAVADLAERARSVVQAHPQVLRPAARGQGPTGGDLIYPWEAREGDWVSVPAGPSGMFVQAVMTMPDWDGVARTQIAVEQWHLFSSGSSHALHVADPGLMIERLSVEIEQARARHQWDVDREEWEKAQGIRVR